MQAQRIEIGVVADAGQHRYHHLDPLGRLGALADINGVFGLQMEIHQIRQYAQYRFAGALLQPIQPRLQQGDITAKAVDHKTLDPRLLALGKQRQGADQMGKHPALVDIGNQDHRAIHRLGKAHIGDIAGAQVDLRWRTGALHHHHRISGAQTLVRLQHRLHRHLFVIVVRHGIHAAEGAAVDDHLGAGVAIGLEQHRIHVGMRRQPGGLGLYCLGAADFATVGGDG